MYSSTLFPVMRFDYAQQKMINSNTVSFQSSRWLSNRNWSTFSQLAWPSSFGPSWQESFWNSRIDTLESHFQQSAFHWCICTWVTGLRKPYSWWQRSMHRLTCNFSLLQSITHWLSNKNGAIHPLWGSSRLHRLRIKKRNWVKRRFNRKLTITRNGRISIRSKVVS